ncbi:MAG: flagellar motor protein MotB [Actinomycetota bacterium]
MANKQHAEAEAIIKRVSRRHEDDAHGGAWKVAFADFCLALMCLFLVLWVLAAREQERVEEWMKAAGGDLLNQSQGRMMDSMGGPRGSLIDRNPMPKGEGASPNAGSSMSQVKKRYDSPADLEDLAREILRMSREAGLAGNLQTMVTPYGLRIMLHDTDRQGMFDRGSAIVNERFRDLLRKMGPLFAQIENQLLLVGHTDSHQYANRSSSAFSNWTLSSQRAMAARVQLLEGGMPSDNILQVVGMAARAPLDTENPKAGVNRRIELLVLTSGQAQAVAAMFGMPAETRPLMDGVDAAVPSRAVMSEARSRLKNEKVSLKMPAETSGN